MVALTLFPGSSPQYETPWDEARTNQVGFKYHVTRVVPTHRTAWAPYRCSEWGAITQQLYSVIVFARFDFRQHRAAGSVGACRAGFEILNSETLVEGNFQYLQPLFVACNRHWHDTEIDR